MPSLVPLTGESHLIDTIRKPVHEALRQRITVHYNYAGLSDDEISKYNLHKKHLAGAFSTIIDLIHLQPDTALRKVIRASLTT